MLELDGDMTLCCRSTANFEEIAEFLRFAGYKSVVCTAETSMNIGFMPDSSGLRLRHTGEIMQCDIKTESPVSFEEYKAVFDTLVICGHFRENGFNDWYADITRRINSSTASLSYIRENGRAVSSASVLFETEDSIFLGAVSTLPECRGRGLAGKIVSSLLTNDKTCRLNCRNNGIFENFYKPLGFVLEGEFTVTRQPLR